MSKHGRVGNTCLEAPKAGGLSFLHISHATFAVSDGRSLLLIDPFFSGRFHWLNSTERHLDRPTIKLVSIRDCDAVLISHEHGDHYDFPAVRALLKQTNAVIHTTKIVIEDATRRGLECGRFRQVKPLRSFSVGAMSITPFPSAGSEKTRPVDRVGFFIECGGRGLFHQGDSQGCSPTWLRFRGKADKIVMWPKRVSEVVTIIQPETVVFHHMDRFCPGNFHCNRSATLELRYWAHYHPCTRFLVPKRNVWYTV